MNVLVTGGFGYVGGRLCKSLRTDPDVRIRLGSRRHRFTPAWLPGATAVRIDWADPASLQRACAGVDTIVHLAGMSAADCSADPAAALEANAVATARLVATAWRAGARRFVFVSTAHVYGRPLAGFLTEQTCPASRHPYASSQRAAEDVVLEAHARGALAGVVVRLSNAFGPPVSPACHCWHLLFTDLCRQAVTAGRMTLRSSSERRDFVSLSNVCSALIHLLRLPSTALGDGLFNLGGEWSPTTLDVALLVQQMAGEILGRSIALDAPRPDTAHAPLEYSIAKLRQTGYGATGDRLSELHSLLVFCRDHFPFGAVR